MVHEIILGRSKTDIEKFGKKGAIFLAKQYIKMGPVTSLANKILMDVTRSHIVFVCGKRGGGKSYTMGVIAEGMANLEPDVSKRLSCIILDTMGIYWTMKYPNHKDEKLLEEWGIEGQGLDVQIFTPAGFSEKYKEQGIPTDFAFSIKPSELNSSDWCITFGVSQLEPLGVLIEKTINTLKEKGDNFSMDDIIKEIEKDTTTEAHVKSAALNRFRNANTWGLFSDKGTALKDLAMPGKITVLDISAYSNLPNGWAIKSLVVGLVSQKLFIERMTARKMEEYSAVSESVHFFSAEENDEKEEMPLVWLIIDEAHEFLPKEGKTLASDPLITILREGREPGISLILASQQPGKIHTDVMTQSDVLIAHRITAKIDIDALGMLMQSYFRAGLDEELNMLPRVKGAALIIDDMNERMYPVRIRPRMTWHGGEAPTALKEVKKKFGL
ncbi:DUF87 domain-containing protein [Candidatus Woesearchaeota archaeon]|nr:DUF87 domain-containing protein [Candidatus Woesearchaeota archaeon]